MIEDMEIYGGVSVFIFQFAIKRERDQDELTRLTQDNKRLRRSNVGLADHLSSLIEQLAECVACIRDLELHVQDMARLAPLIADSDGSSDDYAMSDDDDEP